MTQPQPRQAWTTSVIQPMIDQASDCKSLEKLRGLIFLPVDAVEKWESYDAPTPDTAFLSENLNKNWSLQWSNGRRVERSKLNESNN